jgi:hypothetical protein
MKIEDLIIPGALVIGGYILFTKFKDIFKPLEDIVKPVTDILPPISNLDKPIVPSPKGFPKAPTPINYGVPVTGVPGFVDFAKTPIGGKGTPTPSYGAFLFPPLGIVDAITKVPKLIDETFNKPKQQAYVKTKPIIGTPSERKTIPVSAVPKGAPKKVYYKVKAGKVF